MLVPVELVVWIASILLAGLGAMLTFNVHLLVRILHSQTRAENSHNMLDQRLTQVERKTREQYA